MVTQGPNWTNFWQSERHSFDDVMRMATQYFADRLCEVFDINGDMHVFDYGCGPGFLADVLIPKGVAFSGADINEFFIQRCKTQHPNGNFFAIHADATENAAILQHSMQRQADFIILLSITQYLSNPDDLEKIIVSLKPHLKKSGRIIVADVVDEHTRSYRDALSLLFHSIKNGRVGAFVRFIRYVLRSEYARVAKTTSLQTIPEQFVSEMCKRQDLHCKLEPGLTFHPTRKNYVLMQNG